MRIKYSYFRSVFELLFEYCGNHVLSLSDEDLVGVIYEDYMFCYVDLYEYNRLAFKQAGYITEKIAQKMKTIYELSEEVFAEGVEFSAKFVRNSPTWKKIFDLTDEIKNEINLQ